MKTLIDTTFLWIATMNGKCIMTMNHIFFFITIILALVIGIAIGKAKK